MMQNKVRKFNKERNYNLDPMPVAARILDIPLHRVDFVDEYWNNVFQYFISEYNKNRKPHYNHYLTSI